MSAKGKLFLIISYTPGAGKTFFMLDKALEISSNQKVLIGFLYESHRQFDGNYRELTVAYNNIKHTYNIRDIINLNPDVVLMDELGVRGHNEEDKGRCVYQDVDLLLDNGIDVYSTVNLKKFQVINDKFKKISGIGVKKQIPVKYLDMAEKIYFIDRKPELLIKDFENSELFKERYMKSRIMKRNFSYEILDKYQKLSYDILDEYKDKLEIIVRD